MSNPNDPASPWQMKIILKISGLPRDVVDDCKFRFGDSRDPRDDNAYRIVGAWSFGKGSTSPSVEKARQNGLKMIARRVLPVLQQKKYKERVDLIWGTIINAYDNFQKVFIESIIERCDERNEPERSQIKNWDGKTLSDVLYLIPSVTNPSKEAPDDLIRQKKIMEEELRKIEKWKTDGNDTKHITIGNFEDFWNWMQIIFKESVVVKTKTGIAFDVQATPRGIKIIPSTGDKRDLGENDLRKLFQISKNFNDESMFELKHYEGSNFNASYYVPILKMYAEYWAETEESETEESETEESEKVRKVGDKLEINGKIVTRKTLIIPIIRFLKDGEWHTKKELDAWLRDEYFHITEEEERNVMYKSSGRSVLYHKTANAISTLRYLRWIEDFSKNVSNLQKGEWRLSGWAMKNIVPLNDNKINHELNELHIPKKLLDDEMEDETDNIIHLEYDNKLVLSPDYEKIMKEVTDELLIEEDTISSILHFIRAGNHILLEGPIGTGKTHLAKMLPRFFDNTICEYEGRTYTATTEWSTQDVIGGIIPKLKDDGEATYGINYGCVVATLKENRENMFDPSGDEHVPVKQYWTLIDEFNRAPIDKSFGQLFTALRDGTLRQIPTMNGKDEEMKIPSDYRIIGTLNTQDKSFVFTISDALKSRFVSVVIDVPVIEKSEKEMVYAAEAAREALELPDDAKVTGFMVNDIKDEFNVYENDEVQRNMWQAYWTLASIRLFRKLGTALLKSIYKIMISTFAEKDSINIDDAITAVLIPQLAGLTKQQLGAIKALHSIYGVKTFFKDAHDGELGKKSGYVKLFENVLDFMEKGGGFDKDLKEKWDKDGLVTEFKSSEFKRWDVIDDAHTQFNKKVLSVNLPKFISQLEQLEDNSSM